MSPAKKRKAAAPKQRSRKTVRPKPRPASGLARKAGSKGIAVCDLPASKLAAAFDRPEGAASLLSHVPECGACTTSLTVLAAAGRGLKHLTADGAGTAVERVLAKGQARGQEKLADLVYELVKACLVVVQDVDRRLHLERRPRSAVVIDQELREVVARLPNGKQVATPEVARLTPTESRAMAAAESCIQILKQVEGATERQRLGEAVWLICSGRPAEAESALRLMIDAGVSARSRRFVFQNLPWAVFRQHRLADAMKICVHAVQEFPDDWMVAYNACVAAAWTGDVSAVKRFARALRVLPSGDADESRRRRRQLDHEVPRFAELLDSSTSEVASWFGSRPAKGIDVNVVN